MTQITTTELLQTFQTLLIEVERTKTPLTVIHEGKPLVIIYPAPQAVDLGFGVTTQLV